MARYSPGFIDRLPSGLILGLPGLFTMDNIVDSDYQPEIIDIDFSTNRFNQDRASLVGTSGDALLRFEESEIIRPDEFTCSMWVKNTSNGGDQELISNAKNTSGSVYTWHIRTSGTNGVSMNLQLFRSGGSLINVNFASVTFDEWVHLLWYVSDGDIFTYKDNQLIDSDTNGEAIDYNDRPLVLLNRNDAAKPFPGEIASFYMWDRELSSSERAQVFGFYPLFRGSQGGNTFQRSGKSFSIRSRKKPRFQRTPRTSQSRNNFHHVQSNWRGLSSGDKTSWSDQVANFGRTNSLGIPYELEPIQLFESHNKVLVDSQLSIVETAQAPVSFPNPNLDSLLFTASPGNATVDTDPLFVPADFRFRYYVSGLFPEPSVDPNEVDFTFMLDVDEGVNSDINWFSIWENQFGITAADAGRWLVFRMDILSKLTGQKITQFIEFVEVG